MAELSAIDMEAITRACRHVAAPERPAPYLRQFLIARLDRDNPRLAETVARLDFDGCAALLRAVRLRQRCEHPIGEPDPPGSPAAAARGRLTAETAPDHRA
jgi:hypothetical protein